MRQILKINNPINLTFELINNPKELESQMEGFKFFVNDGMYDRLCNWISFFNMNYAKNLCIYSKSIFSIFKAAKYNQLFRTQTKHEFQTSLKFYERAFNSGFFINFSSDEEATYFLNISLIYGCYPGMVIGSLDKAFSAFSKSSNIKNLHLFFELLFVKYEPPVVLIKSLNYLDITEVKALMTVLQGNNIRLFNELPFSVSKKESFVFINKLPEDLEFKSEVLERSLLCSKLLLDSVDKDLLIPILNSSKIFQLKPYLFYTDLKFWKIVLKFLNKINWSEEIIFTIQEYIDFFEFKKYTLEEDYSLKGRTIQSINRSVYEWHERGDYGDLLKKIDLEWKDDSKLDPVPFKHCDDFYVIKEITNGEDLFKESDYLKHCVFSYIESCANGYVSVWSLSKKYNSVFQSLVTIEVRDGIICQALGKRNRKIDYVERKIIDDWAIRMNYRVDLF